MSSSGTAGVGPSTAGHGASSNQPMGGNPQSAGENSGGGRGGGQVDGQAGGDSAGAPAEAGQPSTAEGGAAGQAPDWPTGIVNEFGFALEDSWLLTPCLETMNSGYRCRSKLGECPNQDATDVEQRGYRFAERFQLGGELGVLYDVTLNVNGIVEGKFYLGGVRRRGNNFSLPNAPEGSDAWHVGGTPTPTTWAIYKLTVFEPDGVTEVEHYYLNSYPQASGFDGANTTFTLGYDATITVPGQGIVEYLSVDPDCTTNSNCGPGDLPATCSSNRNLPNQHDLSLPEQYGGQPLASLNVVTGANQPFHAHLIHVLVTNVVAK